MDECHPWAKSRKTRTRMPGQTDVRWTSSTRQPASDPRSQTAEPQNNRCDVAASCPHSILAKRLECCTDWLSPPPLATKLARQRNMSRRATSGLTHRSKTVGLFDQ